MLTIEEIKKVVAKIALEYNLKILEIDKEVEIYVA